MSFNSKSPTRGQNHSDPKYSSSTDLERFSSMSSDLSSMSSRPINKFHSEKSRFTPNRSRSSSSESVRSPPIFPSFPNVTMRKKPTNSTPNSDKRQNLNRTAKENSTRSAQQNTIRSPKDKRNRPGPSRERSRSPLGSTWMTPALSSESIPFRFDEPFKVTTQQEIVFDPTKKTMEVKTSTVFTPANENFNHFDLDSFDLHKTGEELKKLDSICQEKNRSAIFTQNLSASMYKTPPSDRYSTLIRDKPNFSLMGNASSPRPGISGQFGKSPNSMIRHQSFAREANSNPSASINVLPSGTNELSPSVRSPENFSTKCQIDVHNIPSPQNPPPVVEKSMTLCMEVNGEPTMFTVLFNFHTEGRILNVKPKMVEFDGRKLWENSG